MAIHFFVFVNKNITKVAFYNRKELTRTRKAQMDDDGLKSLCQGLKSCTSLQSLNLNLTQCGISDEGLKTLAKTLKTLSELKDLSLNFSQLIFH